MKAIITIIMSTCYFIAHTQVLETNVNVQIVTAILPVQFVREEETLWNNNTSTPLTTDTMLLNAGDILVAFEIIADNSSTGSITDNGNTGGGTGVLTWIQQQVITSSIGSGTWMSVWTTVLPSNTSTSGLTVSFARTVAQYFGGGVYIFRNGSGIGISAKNNNASGAPSVSLTTTAANSMVVCINGDWSALATARTWRTVNSITPTAGNGLERTYFNQSGQYTVYSAYWNDAGTAGANSYGLTAPATQNYQSIVIEIKK